MKRVLVLLFLLTAPLSAQSWRTALTASADAALWVDVMQTLHGLDNGVHLNAAWADPTYAHPWHEANPILGDHPSTASLLAYNAVWVAGNTFAPKRIRSAINIATLLVEAVVIRHNARTVGFRLTP